MMAEMKRRTIAKAATWRIIATCITVGLALVLTGSAETAIEIGILDVTIKLAAYYGHERAWLRLRFGRHRPSEYPIEAITGAAD